MGRELMHGKWLLLFCAAACLYNAVSGMITGRAVFYGWVTRPDDGYLYWLVVLGSGLFGVAGVLIVTLGT